MKNTNHQKGWETKLRSLKFKEEQHKFRSIKKGGKFEYFTVFSKVVAKNIIITVSYEYPNNDRKFGTSIKSNAKIHVSTESEYLDIVNWRKFQQFTDAFNKLIHAR